MRRHPLEKTDRRPSGHSWHRIGQGFALGIGNYLAIACSALSILLAVLSHIGALGPAADADS